VFHIRTAALSTLLFAAAFSCTSQAASLTLDPGSALQVGPGELTGWGFTFDNGDGFAVLSLSIFSPSNGIGSYTDLIASQFIIVPPNTGFVESFDPSPPAGIGEFQVNPAAAQASFAAGTITLFYDLFGKSPDDPTFNPDEDGISFGNSVSAGASVDVSVRRSPENADARPGHADLRQSSV